MFLEVTWDAVPVARDLAPLTFVRCPARRSAGKSTVRRPTLKRCFLFEDNHNLKGSRGTCPKTHAGLRPIRSKNEGSETIEESGPLQMSTSARMVSG